MAGKKKRRIALWTAIIVFLTALAGCAEKYIVVSEMSSYRAPAQELERQAEVIARALIDKLNVSRVNIVVMPVFVATPHGGDIYFEGGYELPYPPASQASSDEISTTVQDYPLGEYLLSKAPGSQVIMSATRESVVNFLKQNAGSHAEHIEIIGCADGASFLPGVLYPGDPTTFRDFQYYSEDRQRLEKITLIPGVTKLDNNSLAFLRAYSASKAIANIKELSSAQPQISTATTLRRGGIYRRVIVRITIKNGVIDRYSDLSWPARFLIDRSQRADMVRVR